MATRDEIILGLYNNVDVDALVMAKRAGNLLAYYSALADRIVGIEPTPRREEAVAAAGREMLQQATNARGQTMEDRVARLDSTPAARAIPEETRRAIAEEVDRNSLPGRRIMDQVDPVLAPNARRNADGTERQRTPLFPVGTDRVQVRQV